MTWKEFLLRLDGYIRHNKEGWKMTRFIAYQVYASTPMKNKPVSIEKYLPLEAESKPIVTDSVKDIMREQYKKIKEKLWQEQTS